MHIGIHVKILIAHRIEHAQWFLGGCRIVEIHQRLAIDLSRENREIRPYLIQIVHYFFLVFMWTFSQVTVPSFLQWTRTR